MKLSSPIISIRFGSPRFGSLSLDKFKETVIRHKGEMSPQAIAEKQKALLALVENQINSAGEDFDGRKSWEALNAGATILQLYALVLASLASANQKKGDPIATLERLEQLIKLTAETSTQEGSP